MIRLSDDPKSGTNKLVLASLITAFGVILVRTAWLCDDAYISFRVIDNFVNGYGLVWNVSERVQVFSHPLWLLLMTGVFAITREVYFSSIFLSILLAILTVTLVGFRLSRSLASAILALLVLSVSKSFVEYSTSGLENSLTFLLLAVFYWRYLSNKFELREFFVLSLVAALATLNRLDTILLTLPSLIFAYSKIPKKSGAIVGIAGFLPLLLWFAFSLVYYGFVLPNTFYAKLHTGIESFDLMWQGLHYFEDSLRYDPITLIAIIFGSVVAFRSKDWRRRTVAIGIVFYLIFIVRVGGDFMSGRFFAAPLLCSVAIIVGEPINLSHKKFRILVALMLIYGIFWPGSPVVSGKDLGIIQDRVIRRHGIANERAYYFQGTGLLFSGQNKGVPNFRWYRSGEEWRTGNEKAKVFGAVGFSGVAAGPNIHIIDEHALTDPLLARLPVYNTSFWRIGHFKRMVPKGYIETIETSQNKIADSNLAVFYDKIKMITSGNLFTKERWTEIFKVNFGQYEYLIEKYQAKAILEVVYDSINVPKASGTMWRMGGNTVMNKNGLRVLFSQKCHSNLLEISVDNNDVYRLVFLNGQVRLSEFVLDSIIIPSGGLRVDTLEIPDAAVRAGFDVIEIYPSGPDESYSVGHIRVFGTLEDSESNTENEVLH